MKKLMVALAVVAVGFAAQAATVSWSASNIMIEDGMSTTWANYTGYLINADVWSTADAALAALKKGETTGKLMETNGKAQFTATDRFGMSVTQAAIKSKGTPDWAENDVLNSYLLIIDSTSAATATKYMVAEDTNTSPTKFSNALLAKPSFGTQEANTWQSVPEPTSGLLLLLGVAGLALKRKRA